MGCLQASRNCGNYIAYTHWTNTVKHTSPVVDGHYSETNHQDKEASLYFTNESVIADRRSNQQQDQFVMLVLPCLK